MRLRPRQLLHFLLRETIWTWEVLTHTCSTFLAPLSSGSKLLLDLSPSWEHTIETLILWPIIHCLPPSPPSTEGSYRAGFGLSVKFDDVNYPGCQTSSWCFWILLVGHDKENVFFFSFNSASFHCLCLDKISDCFSLHNPYPLPFRVITRKTLTFRNIVCSRRNRSLIRNHHF